MVGRGMRSDNTLRHWRKLKRHVTAFIKYQYKLSDLKFSQLSGLFAEELYDYLIGVKKDFITRNPMEGFTGFAYQDIYNLTRDSIVLVGTTKERWLVRKRGKTQVGEMVPILPIVDELIQKYMGTLIVSHLIN